MDGELGAALGARADEGVHKAGGLVAAAGAGELASRAALVDGAARVVEPNRLAANGAARMAVGVLLAHGALAPHGARARAPPAL